MEQRAAGKASTQNTCILFYFEERSLLLHAFKGLILSAHSFWSCRVAVDSLPPVTTPAFLDTIFGVWIQYPVLLLIAGRSDLALSFLTRKRTHKVSEFPSGSPKISAPDSNLPLVKSRPAAGLHFPLYPAPWFKCAYFLPQNWKVLKINAKHWHKLCARGLLTIIR